MMELLIGMSANILSTYGIKCFIELFLSEEEYHFKYPIILYGVYWLLTSISYCFSFPILNLGVNIIGVILVLIPYKISWMKKLATAILTLCIYTMIDGMLVFLFVQNYQYGDYITSWFKWLDSIVLIFIVLLLKRTVSFTKNIELPLVYYCMLIGMPSISAIVILYIAHWENLSTNGMIVLSVGLFCMNILIFYLYYFLGKFYIESKEKESLKQIVAVYKNQLKIMQESKERVQSLRHDLKHHLIELISMAQKEKELEIENYLIDMKKFMLNPEEYIATGNQDIDSVVNYYIRKAEKFSENVTLNIKVSADNFCGNFYLCMILGNLLDNAVEATKFSEEKKLYFTMVEKKGFLLILLKNSCENTTKNKKEKIQNEREHYGIGLKNVKRIIQLLDGEMEIEHKYNMFQVKIIIYIEALKKINN